MSLLTLLSDAAEIILPRCCLVCGRPLFQRWICSSCTPRSHFFSPALTAWPLLPFDAVHTIWGYQGAERRFITAMKYRPSKRLADQAGMELAQQLRAHIASERYDVLVPVPSSRKNFQTRLFNQAAALAKQIACACHIPYLPTALKHCGYRAPQASLSGKKRYENVQGIFEVRSNALKGKRVLLVDDVLTSGATAASAAQTLLRAGARSIEVAALARSDSWVSHLCALEERFSRTDAAKG